MGGTDPVTGPGNGFGQLTAVRMAPHVNYDRFVLEFRDNVPAHDISYAEPPFLDIPGNLVGIAGNAFLAVNLHGASIVDWGAPGEEIVLSYEGPHRIRAATLNYTEAVFVTDFEGEMEWILGLADTAPFRVIVLANPARLVIDVGHGTVTTRDVATQWVSGTGTGFGWLTDARLAGHPGYDRFVVEFSPDYRPEPEYPEPGVPDYDVHYVTGPFGGCDSPETVPAGTAYILVNLHGAAHTDWRINPPVIIYNGPDRLSTDTANLTEVVLVNDCEGIQWVIGVDEATTFTVSQLQNPPRLVIDVAA